MLTERYRPKTLDEVAGQTKAKEKLRRLANWGGRAFWLSGPSGSGKTTIARIIAAELADPMCQDEEDPDITPTRIDELTRKWAGRPLFLSKVGYSLTINEAHGLRKDTIRKLLNLLERIPSYCVIIFTTTKAGQKSLFDDKIDAGPLLSRCIDLPMAMEEETIFEFACHARKVAQAENLDGKPIETYIDLVRGHNGNLRACLQDIEAGALVS